MSQHPDWLIERAALGEAPKSFEPDAAALDRIRESNEEILAALPPAAVAAEIERRVRARREPRKRAPFVLYAAAAAFAALILFFVFRSGDEARLATHDTAELDSGIRIKGQTRLVIHTKRADGVLLLEPNTEMRAGDLLQISYVAGGRRHGVIVSIDGRGSATLHFPESPSEPTTLEPTKTTALGHAYRLDDAPSFERFIFVTSNSPLNATEILRAAERLAKSRMKNSRLPLPPTIAQTSDQISFVIRKPEMP